MASVEEGRSHNSAPYWCQIRNVIATISPVITLVFREVGFN